MANCSPVFILNFTFFTLLICCTSKVTSYYVEEMQNWDIGNENSAVDEDLEIDITRIKAHDADHLVDRPAADNDLQSTSHTSLSQKFFSLIDYLFSSKKAVRDGNREKKAGCKTCGPSEEEDDEEIVEQIKSLRIEEMKTLLAEKLHTNPAQIESQSKKIAKKIELPKLPQELLARFHQEEEEENEEVPEVDLRRVVLSGYDMGRDCLGMASTGCFEFHLSDHVKVGVTSAHLWLYKSSDRHDKAGQTLQVYEVNRDLSGRLQPQSEVARQNTTASEDWIKFDVTQLVQSWSGGSNESHILATRCLTCHLRNHRSIFGEKNGYRPLLLIRLPQQKKISRERRSTCHSGRQCCKFSLNLDLYQLGYVNILNPTHIDIGYCYGFCTANAASVSQGYNYTTLKALAAGSGRGQTGRLRFCCVPTEYNSRSFTYGAGGELANVLINHAVVTRCGCR